MPFCRKCGAKLDETAKFCHVCGTPVLAATAEKGQAVPPRRPVYLLPVIILTAVLLTAIVISAVLFLPFYPVNFSQTNQVAKTNVSNLLVDFKADVANVNIFFRNLPGSMVVLNVTAKGNVGVLDDPNQAVNVTFNHQTTTNFTEVISSVSRSARWPIFYSLDVNCDVYIDPSANVSLNFRSSVGNVMMDANSKTTFQNIDLETTTGNINASLSKDVTVAGSISLKSTTGTIQFRIDEAEITNNISVNLRSTTGLVNIDLAETRILEGNVTMNARTTTGGVNLSMVVDGDVGARIESHTDVGRIIVDARRFSGNQTLLQSNNYPAKSNFLVNLRTTTGGININAAYGSSTVLN